MGVADLNYLRMREEQEQAAAERAACPEARRSHEELAARYRAMLAGEQSGSAPEGSAKLHYLWQPEGR